MPTPEQYQVLRDAQAAVDYSASDADYNAAIENRHEAERTFNAAADADLEAEAG